MRASKWASGWGRIWCHPGGDKTRKSSYKRRRDDWILLRRKVWGLALLHLSLSSGFRGVAKGSRVGSFNARFTHQHLEPNQPLPCELCASAAITNVATRAVTSARIFTTLTPMTASRCWRCWAVVPALSRGIAIVWRATPTTCWRKRPRAAVLDRAQPGPLAKDVAYSVGFNDLSYFTRAFKRQLGVCPSDYQAGARLS